MAYFFTASLLPVSCGDEGTLLEITLRVVGSVKPLDATFCLLGQNWGAFLDCSCVRLLVHIHSAVECMRRTIAGMDADVPFVCDAA